PLQGESRQAGDGDAVRGPPGPDRARSGDVLGVDERATREGRRAAVIVPDHERAALAIRGEHGPHLTAQRGADGEPLGGPGRVDDPVPEDVLRVDVDAARGEIPRVLPRGNGAPGAIRDQRHELLAPRCAADDRAIWVPLRANVRSHEQSEDDTESERQTPWVHWRFLWIGRSILTEKSPCAAHFRPLSSMRHSRGRPRESGGTT